MSESMTVTVGLDVHARSIRLAAVRSDDAMGGFDDGEPRLGEFALDDQELPQAVEHFLFHFHVVRDRRFAAKGCLERGQGRRVARRHRCRPTLAPRLRFTVPGPSKRAPSAGAGGRRRGRVPFGGRFWGRAPPASGVS